METTVTPANLFEQASEAFVQGPAKLSFADLRKTPTKSVARAERLRVVSSDKNGTEVRFVLTDDDVAKMKVSNGEGKQINVLYLSRTMRIGDLLTGAQIDAAPFVLDPNLKIRVTASIGIPLTQ